MALLQQAVGLHRGGRLTEALAIYDQILAAEPDHADALNLSGLIRLAQGDAATAATLIARAVKLAPTSPLFRLNLGTAQAAMGNPDKAIASFERALKLKPDLATAWAALGNARAVRSEERKAIHALRRAVAFDPQLAEAWNNLALVLGRIGEQAEARTAIETAIKLRPDFAVAHNSAGALARERGDIEASVEHLRRAVTLLPGYFEAHSNLGVSLAEAGRHEDAIAAFDAALRLNTHRAETWRAASKPLVALGDMDRARLACERALALAPEDRSTIWEKALIDLASGRFADGWEGYRARSMVDRSRRAIPQNRLDGDLTGRTIVIEGEQGLGEELFFLRFAAPLKTRGARVVAHVDARLASMVARIPFIDEAVARSDAGTPARGAPDCFLLGDLPWLAGPDNDTTHPAPINAIDSLRAEIRARLAAAGPAPYMGLTWRAGIAGRGTLFKEAPIDLITGALRDCAATPIALQRNPHDGEIAALNDAIGRKVADFTDLNDNLEAMLALMFEIGGYVAVSNTNVHLAACARAAGASVRCHVLVPCPAEFRWLASGAQSPWFPGFPVYREDARQGWAPVRASLARAIASI